MTEPAFTPIDLESWKRREIFHYFSSIAPTTYSITEELDITELKRVLKAHNLKFYPAYLFLVTRSISVIEELRIGYRDKTLGIWSHLTPFYAVFHPDDNTFSLMWTEYCNSFPEFYRRFMEDKEKYGDNHGLLSKKDQLPPPSAYTVSSLPWLSFKSFSLYSSSPSPYFFPSVETGKFRTEGDRLILPLSITLHHGTTDGYHVASFFSFLQNAADNFNLFLD